MPNSRALLLSWVAAASLLVPATPAAAETGYVFAPLPQLDGGGANPSQAVPISLGGSPTPQPFSIATGCTSCAFALVHIYSQRVSSDAITVSFGDAAMRFSTPVAFYLGDSDSDGATGTKAGGFWSPLHDVWTLAPVGSDGSVAGSVGIGGWNASFCSGTGCTGTSAPAVVVEVAALLVPDGTPGGMRTHFPAAGRIPAYQLIGGTSIDETVPLPDGVPSDAVLYLGAVEEDRISGDNTDIVVNGRNTQVACSDASAFSGPGVGAMWSPIHAHEIAWPPNAGAPDMLHVKVATGGWMTTHGSNVQPSVEVGIDGWVGGSQPRGDVFYPGAGEIEKVSFDSSGKGTVVLPADVTPGGHTPDVVVALVTAGRYASDWVTIHIGDKIVQLGTSSAHNNGNTAGAAYDPVHTDLVFARPTVTSAGVTLPISIATGGFVDQQTTKPDYGVSVQLLGSFMSPLGSEAGVNGDGGGGSPAGCGCTVPGSVPMGTGGGLLVLLALVLTALWAGRRALRGRAR